MCVGTENRKWVDAIRRGGRKRRLPARELPTLACGLRTSRRLGSPWLFSSVRVSYTRVPSMHFGCQGRGPAFGHFFEDACHHPLTHTSHGVSGFRTHGHARAVACGVPSCSHAPFECSRAIEVRDDRTNRSGGRGRGRSLRMWLGVRPCPGLAHSNRRCRDQATRRDPKLRPRGSCESDDRSLRERRAGSRGPHALRHRPRPTAHGCG